MSKFEKELFHTMDAVEELLQITENPKHRAILMNYRKHVHYECSGQFDKIVAPDMMVDEPVYRILWGTPIIIKGKEAVLQFYNQLGDAVLWNTDERIAVADWGFASELTLNQLAPGRELKKLGVEVDDDNAYYHFQSRQAFVWPYDENARLVGEHIYEDISTRKVEKVNPDDIIAPEREAEIHRMLLENLE